MEEEYEVTELEQKPTTPKNAPPPVEMMEKVRKRGDQAVAEIGDKKAGKEVEKSEREAGKSEKQADVNPEREVDEESFSKDGMSEKVG